jgi:hypothetical protein
MYRHAVVSVAAAVLIGAASSPAVAHHSYGAYFDLCKSVTLEGRVDNVRWQNPHIYLDVTTDDRTTYLVEWTKMWDSRTAAGKPEALKTGDRIVVTGSPIKDVAKLRAAYPVFKGNPDPKMVSAILQIRRVGDGWTWSTGGKPTAEECAAAAAARK